MTADPAPDPDDTTWCVEHDGPVDRPCPYCEIERLKAENLELQRELNEAYYNQCGCL